MICSSKELGLMIYGLERINLQDAFAVFPWGCTRMNVEEHTRLSSIYHSIVFIFYLLQTKLIVKSENLL